MSEAQMHSEAASAPQKGKEVRCPVDDRPFVQRRPWQKFCSTGCRNAWHHSMTPEALRKDLDALRRRLDELEAAAARVPA